jgi:hypothetical protein
VGWFGLIWCIADVDMAVTVSPLPPGQSVPITKKQPEATKQQLAKVCNISKLAKVCNIRKT